MNYLGNNKLARIALSLLAVGVMSFGVLGILTMAHQEMSMLKVGKSIVQSTGCADGRDGQACLNFHLGIMQNLSTAARSNLDIFITVLSLVSFVVLLALVLFILLQFFYTRQRIRFRQLYQKTIFAFARQLGAWLTLFEKRDPAYALTTA